LIDKQKPRALRRGQARVAPIPGYSQPLPIGSVVSALFAPIPLAADEAEREFCGQPITPHPLKRFCSNSCRLKARYGRVKNQSVHFSY
jgi:hypothetical protein